MQKFSSDSERHLIFGGGGGVGGIKCQDIDNSILTYVVMVHERVKDRGTTSGFIHFK